MEELRWRTTSVCGVIVFAIALSVLLRGRRAAHLLFAAFATCVAAWYASQALSRFFPAAMWSRATGVLTILLPQLAVHVFESIMPSEGKERRSTQLSRVATISGVPMLLVVLSPYYKHPLALGTLYFYVLGLITAALYTLHRRGQGSASRAIRDRVRFLVVIGAIATTFTLADFLSFLGVPLPPIGAVLATVFIFVLSESLQRRRLADLYELTGRLLVSTVLAFCLAGIFYGFITYIGRFGAMYLNAVLAAIVFLVLFEPLRAEVDKRIRQFFFRERYDLETSIAEVQRRLAHTMEAEEIGTTLMLGLERARRVTGAALYIRDPDGFARIGMLGESAPHRLEALALRPVLERLGTSTSLEELLRSEVEADALAATAAANLGPLRMGILLAVRDDDNELIGLLCVADERIRDAFAPEEIVLLEALAAQVGVAITNTRVYSKLKERDRLATLGAMAAGLAHEVKNPLGAIKGAAQLLEEAMPAAADATTRDFVGIIVDETNRLNRVVSSFLDYARPHAGNPVPLDVNAVVRRTVQIVASAEEHRDIELSLELEEDLPYASIDAEQLRQVLINLVRNATQAMNGQGTIVISTSMRPSSRAFGREDDTYVEISVRDNGPGIGPKELPNLFVPFFTTKEQGTGLGLAISQRIIQTVGGRVEVHSQAGQGTTFTVVLPVAKEKMLSPSAATTTAGEPSVGLSRSASIP